MTLFGIEPRIFMLYIVESWLKSNQLKSNVSFYNHLPVELQQRISRLTDATSALIQETRGKIKSLSKANQDARVKETQQKLLAKNLVTAAKEFQAIQQDAKRQYKTQMERQYRIARPNATNDEIQYAIEHTDGQFFQQELMSARVGEQKRALQEVQQRNNDILKIEQSVNELFNMFQEMEMLLENQQGMVDAIEQHVDNTVDHMEQGSKQLTTAIVHAKSARRKKWFLFICCIIVLIILGVLAYLYFSGNLIKPAPTPSTPTSNATK